MHATILEYLQISPLVAYILTGLGVAFDGEPFLFAAAYLAFQGFINPYIVTLIIFVMTIVGDIGWYYLGTQIDRLPKVVRFWAEGIARPFDREITKHPVRIFFWSKFAYGIHHALWARTGSLKIPLKKYLLIDFFATIPWILILGGITYVFSEAFDSVTRYIGYIEVTLLFGLIIFVYAQRKIGKYVTRQLSEHDV